MRLFGPALEAADAFVDQRQQVGNAVRDRRIGRQRGLFIGLAQKRGVGRAAEPALGFRDEVPQRIDFLGNRRTAAEQNFGELLQPEEPERQIEIVGIDHDRIIREGGGKLVVRVENENAQRRVRLQRLVHQQRDSRGLADACGADHCKVTRKKGGDVDLGGQRAVLRQHADLGGVGGAEIVDALEIRRAHAVNDGAKIGVLADAGGKLGLPVLAGTDFTDEFHLDVHDVVFAFVPAIDIGVHRADEGDDAVLADADRDQPAHRPEFGELGRTIFRDGTYRGACAGAGDDTAKKPVAGFECVATVFSARRGPGAVVLDFLGSHNPTSTVSGATLRSFELTGSLSAPSKCSKINGHMSLSRPFFGGAKSGLTRWRGGGRKIT